MTSNSYLFICFTRSVVSKYSIDIKFIGYSGVFCMDSLILDSFAMKGLLNREIIIFKFTTCWTVTFESRGWQCCPLFAANSCVQCEKGPIAAHDD